MRLNEQYEPVIGLEVHAQMLTATKAFCGCSTQFGSEPNTNVCPVCLGMPGTLPVLNRQLVEFIIRVGLALGCRVSSHSTFARKNYFYPDLPKGYQISQYEEPICSGGFLDVDAEDGGKRRIRITRIHMEEDAGKSIHDVNVDTVVDANRCGIPLIEIVSEPDIRSPHEAYLYLSHMRQMVTYLEICDGNMEEGSLRCDANVSVRKKGTTEFGTKTEIKNLNSFRHVERALQFEIDRQMQLIEDGGAVIQETMFWDANQNVAIPMRSKEEAHDYRYFPEPDLLPVIVDQPWVERVRASLPELPAARRDRFVAELGLPRYDADVLTGERDVADYYEGVLSTLQEGSRLSRGENAKAVSNWVMTDVLRAMGDRKTAMKDFPISPRNLADMIALIQDGTISGKIAKDLFEEMLVSGEDPATIVRLKGMIQVSDEGAIERAVETALAANKSQVEKYLKGNEKIFGFFVGETMKIMKGKANPQVVNAILHRKLQIPKG